MAIKLPDSFKTLTAAVWILWVLTLGLFLYTIPETVNYIKIKVGDKKTMDEDTRDYLEVAGWSFITAAMIASLVVAISLSMRKKG